MYLFEPCQSLKVENLVHITHRSVSLNHSSWLQKLFIIILHHFHSMIGFILYLVLCLMSLSICLPTASMAELYNCEKNIITFVTKSSRRDFCGPGVRSDFPVGVGDALGRLQDHG